MIPAFERAVRLYGSTEVLTFIEHDGQSVSFSYLELKLLAVALASELEKRGVRRGHCVSLDMGNCPGFIISILAAAYGGFSLAVLNRRLSDEEKNIRMRELRMSRGLTLAYHLNEARVSSLLRSVEAVVSEDPRSRGTLFGRGKKQEVDQFFLTTDQRSLIHFAERNAALYTSASDALILFTSGSSGTSKAVVLSWDNICGSARAANSVLSGMKKPAWQLTLPLFHVGGFEIVIRAILAQGTIVLHRRFDAKEILRAANLRNISHISVVDKMLQDMLREDSDGVIQSYACIALGGAAINPATLSKALLAGAQIYASYGMTETSSMVAGAWASRGFSGGLEMLPGYEAQIIPKGSGNSGQLAVKGPGVFSRYLQGKPAFTLDGYFLTGDEAYFQEGKLHIRERTKDMFVSGGENVYPAEIQNALFRIKGVKDAYVFGAKDEAWGRRPIAFLEKDASIDASPQMFSAQVKQAAGRSMSKLNLPDKIFTVDEFPRTGIGKIDRQTLRRRYYERLEIKEIHLYRIRQKLVHPFETAKTRLDVRESIIVEILDWKGRSGLGECVAFSTDWYLPETLDKDAWVLEKILAPLVLDQSFLHPREIDAVLREQEKSLAYPLARGALEPAFWDLYGKIVGKPLWQLLNEEVAGTDNGQGTGKQRRLTEDRSVNSHGAPQATSSVAHKKVPAGLVIGVLSIQETLRTIEEAMKLGYTRYKIKIKPGDDVERVRAIRKAFPHIQLSLDANQSYSEKDWETFKELDKLDIYCVEEPFDPAKVPHVGPRGLNARLARLQNILSMKVCLDESIQTHDEACAALHDPGISSIALKIGKWGGIGPSLGYYQEAVNKGVDIWMGGMYETGVSKFAHAAFQTLPGIAAPGDLSSTSRYFTTEIVKPGFIVEDGMIALNQAGNEHGLGCTLDRRVLQEVLVDVRVMRGSS